METHRHDLVSYICSVCSTIPWILLMPEDLPAQPHHKSLDALITSTKTCRLCKLILHAAVSNYRRSLDPPEGQLRWKRFDTVGTIDNPATGAVRKITYVKELGECMVAHESDVCENRGGYFTNVSANMDWGMDFRFNRTYIIATGGNGRAGGVAPIEDEPINLEELRKLVPATHGVWVYGNHWNKGETANFDESIKDLTLNMVGIGARFGSSGLVFDVINNPTRSLHIRGSALSICTDEGNFLFSTWRIDGLT